MSCETYMLRIQEDGKDVFGPSHFGTHRYAEQIALMYVAQQLARDTAARAAFNSFRNKGLTHSVHDEAWLKDALKGVHMGFGYLLQFEYSQQKYNPEFTMVDWYAKDYKATYNIDFKVTITKVPTVSFIESILRISGLLVDGMTAFRFHIFSLDEDSPGDAILSYSICDDEGNITDHFITYEEALFAQLSTSGDPCWLVGQRRIEVLGNQ